MKPWLRLALTALFLLSAACGCRRPRPISMASIEAWRRERVRKERRLLPDLRCTITAPPVVRLGEPIIVRFTLQNAGVGQLHFMPLGTPLDGIGCSLFEVYRNGEGLPYRGIWACRSASSLNVCEERGCALGEDAYIQLDARESVSVGLDDEDIGFSFSRPGLYEIGYRAGLIHADEGPLPPYDTDPSLRKKPRRIRYAGLRCQSATVLVVAPDVAITPEKVAP